MAAGIRGLFSDYFRSAVHHEIPHCEILHFVPVFLFGMTTLLFLLPVDKICENDVILARRGVGSFPPQPLQLTNRINSGNDLTLHSPKAPLVEEFPIIQDAVGGFFPSTDSASYPLPV